MTVAAVKTWVPREQLNASDLNKLNTNILDNQESLGTPRSSSYDLNGNELILDAGGTSSITADTNNQIDIRIAGSDVVVITATDMTFNSDSLLGDGARVQRVESAILAAARANQLHVYSMALYSNSISVSVFT